MFFFFFKQKTAYEMRISDWSSDVCSSDLQEQQLHPRTRLRRHRHLAETARHPGLAGREGICERPRRQGERGGGGHQFVGGHAHVAEHVEIGSASWRERVCQYV